MRLMPDMSWYRIVLHPLVNTGKNLWCGRADIVRNDTGEVVKKVRVKLVHGKEKAKDSLDKKLKDVLSSIDLPKDWNNPDIVRFMFHQYEIFRRKRENFHQMMYEGIEKNEITHLLADYEKCVLEYAISFHEKYMNLTMADKIRLVGTTEEEGKNPELLINKLSARSFFMRIIYNPDQEVSQAYKDMRELIKKYQEEGKNDDERENEGGSE
jgi:hypothetical protein